MVLSRWIHEMILIPLRLCKFCKNYHKQRNGTTLAIALTSEKRCCSLVLQTVSITPSFEGRLSSTLKTTDLPAHPLLGHSSGAHVFLQAESHQASWLRASVCHHSAFAKSLCINIKHSNSLCAALAELGILMLPNRSNILLCFSGSKANSRAPLKANSLYNQDNYCHVDTEKKWYYLS